MTTSADRSIPSRSVGGKSPENEFYLRSSRITPEHLLLNFRQAEHRLLIIQ